MSGRDRKDKKKKEGFSANPFEALKGFAVESGKKKKPALKDSASWQPRNERSASEDEGEDDAGLFARQMEQLGVEAMAEQDDRLGAPVPEKPSMSRPADTPKAPRTDEEFFRQSLGEMDVCFREEGSLEDEPPPPTPQPRRMKQVRRGTLRPEARLDLHGLSRQQAVERVAFFLQDCAHQGLQTVLLITGRGYGSQEGPVLRPEIEKYLCSFGRSWAAEWGRAPKRYGGEGALVVFLRGSGDNAGS